MNKNAVYNLMKKLETTVKVFVWTWKVVTCVVVSNIRRMSFFWELLSIPGWGNWEVWLVCKVRKAVIYFRKAVIYFMKVVVLFWVDATLSYHILTLKEEKVALTGFVVCVWGFWLRKQEIQPLSYRFSEHFNDFAKRTAFTA